MAGVVVGVALQLQQSALWPVWGYAALILVAGLVVGWLVLKPQRRHRLLVCLVAAACAWACTGWRAAVFQSHAMPAQWEGRDVRVQGIISALPQGVERGVRLQLNVERAWAAHGPALNVPLPQRIALTWYGAMPQQGLQAGQRWEWTVRLKAPHGERNPHSGCGVKEFRPRAMSASCQGMPRRNGWRKRAKHRWRSGVAMCWVACRLR